MSRTDKDRPEWIGDTYRESHHIECRLDWKPCDLPEPNDANIYRRYTRCSLEAIRDDGRHWWMHSPPKWYTDHVWNNPQRVKERDRGRRMIAEYRATGDVDTEIESFQHKHQSKWYWW